MSDLEDILAIHKAHELLNGDAKPLTLDELLDDDGILAEVSRIDSRRRLQVVRRGWGQAMLGISMNQPLQDVGVYADSWDFPTRQAALDAMEAWNPELSPEPRGWHRHPSTGRFHIRGDEKLEYVKDTVGDSIETQVAYAVKVTQGEEYEIRKVEEDYTITEGPTFPNGLRAFYATCEYLGQQCGFDVYYLFGRYVVISPFDADIDNIKQRLTDPWPNP